MTADGQLNVVPHKWGDKTFMVVHAPAPTESRELKSQVLQHAITTVRNSDAKWGDKTDFIATHFNSTFLKQEATLQVAGMDQDLGNVYQYKFLIDRKIKITDPAGASVEPDGFGGLNSTIDVR